MARQMILFITILLIVSVLFNNISSQQCGIATYSVYQMMLRGHTFNLASKARQDVMSSSTVRYRSTNLDLVADLSEFTAH